jgi:DNA-binding NtrC family response regulator
MREPPRVLSVCRKGGPLFTRNLVLEQAGYIVATAMGIDEALTALDRERFDVVIVGHLYSTVEKEQIAMKARRSGSKVLCMHAEPQPPNITAATAFIHHLDGPERLISSVAVLTENAASA